MIRFKNVTKKFKINETQLSVIKQINFNVYQGEVFGLIGETGSGKSTLLRLMNGFILPDEGSIHLMGKSLNETTRKTLVKETSMIFQNFNLINNLNVIDNVCLPTTLRKGNKKQNKIKAKDLLNYVGLKNFEQSTVRNLSGGQKQRVAIARALMTDPKVILCDEPTSALDDKMSHEILTLLRDINLTFSTTIVLVSHNLSVIKSLCHRVAILEDGCIKEIMTLNRKELTPTSYREALLND